MGYKVPFQITNEMLTLISRLSEKLGRINNYKNLSRLPKLRKQNRIRSVYSSCAIEANSLSLDQVKDIINGIQVIGPKKDIIEINNAIEAYNYIDKINPYSIKDLLKIHKIMTKGLINEPGDFRKGEEGVFEGEKCIFVAPPAERVPQLVDDLFKFIKDKKDEIHPLILSSIFHYEFVFMHPFSDGNGRMARFMQNALLGEFNPIFYWLPIENYIKDYQKDYYKAISESTKDGESTKFILFMLQMIDKTLDEAFINIKKHENHINKYIKKMLDVMDEGVYMTSKEIMEKLNLKSKETFRRHYMDQAIEADLVELEFPDKPTSKNQRYIKK